MSMLEEQVRSALRAHAEEFTAHPDAWLQLRTKSVAAGRRRPALRGSWRAKSIVPAAAAATVIVIVVVAATVAGTFGRTASSGTGPFGSLRPAPSRTMLTASPAPPGPYSRSGPGSEMLRVVPPASAIIGLRVPWTGPGSKPDKVMAYFWLGYGKPSYWVDQVTPGLQLCHDMVNAANGESGGFCWPLPQLNAGQQASVTGNENVGTNQRILVGVAGARVASVTATLPDGRTYPGVVMTGRGFRDQAWTVGYPPSAGVRLVFLDASGEQVASLGTAGPAGPPQLARPHNGGVTMLRDLPGFGDPGDVVVAYLVQGRVGFWSSSTGTGLICPVPANGKPALGGMIPLSGGSDANGTAFGYAHANVTRVVLQFPGGQATATTFTAGWKGSAIKLWSAALPRDVEGQLDPPAITVTGYDAAGHVVQRVDLGSGVSPNEGSWIVSLVTGR